MRNYRILRLLTSTPCTTACQRMFNADSFAEKSYEDALESYRRAGFLHPPGFAHHFRKLGHEVLESIIDFPPMQKKWALENGLKDPLNESFHWWFYVEEQIKKFRPDVLFFERSEPFFLIPLETRRRIKQMFPSIKAICGTWGAIGVDYSCFSDIDLIFCIDTAFAAGFRNAGVRSEVCYHCFDDFLDPYLQEQDKIEDFVFPGVSGYGYLDHRQRYSDLYWMMQKTPLKIWAEEPEILQTMKKKIRFNLVKFLAHSFSTPGLKYLYKWAHSFHEAYIAPMFILRDSLLIKGSQYPHDWVKIKKPLRELYPDRIFSPVFGIDYLRLLQRSKIVLNIHIDDPIHFGNIRTFEVCGVGSCLLSDRKEQMQSLFKPDEEVAFYSSKEECLEKAQYLLAHETARNEMARKAKLRVAKEHTFKHRVLIMDEEIQKLLRK